jgi:hypothetical protein
MPPPLVASGLTPNGLSPPIAELARSQPGRCTSVLENPTTPSTETAALELKSTAFDACHIGPARGALGPGDPALGVPARCTSTQYHCLVRAA